jgi:hypothetical protein
VDVPALLRRLILVQQKTPGEDDNDDNKSPINCLTAFLVVISPIFCKGFAVKITDATEAVPMPFCRMGRGNISKNNSERYWSGRHGSLSVLSKTARAETIWKDDPQMR